MARKRKSSEILEILNDKSTNLPTPDPSDHGANLSDVPTPNVSPPIDLVIEKPLETPVDKPVEGIVEKPVPEKKTLKRKEKDPLAEELKRIRKSQEEYKKYQEEQEKRMEARLESMLTRKLDFMKPVPVQKPMNHYKPRQPTPIKRFVPPVEERSEWEGYMTQEESEEEENSLFNKIFS